MGSRELELDDFSQARLHRFNATQQRYSLASDAGSVPRAIGFDECVGSKNIRHFKLSHT